MPLKKDPVSLLSGNYIIYFLSLYLTTIAVTATLGLLVSRVWYRIQARIQSWIYSGSVFPGTSTSYPSRDTRIPLDIVKMMIAHLIYDEFSLLAYSLTSYSWYLAAVPHLHHTLITPVYLLRENEQLRRPDSFRHIYELGLFPLVKKFHVKGVDPYVGYRGPITFSPTQFDSCILHQFSTLTSIRELGIDSFDVYSFMPNVRQYFGHFSPTVQSLALRKPKGSRRQIIFIIGLFQHLEDVKLLYDSVDFQEEPADDLTLIPSFVPPLQGRLTMTCFTRVGILEDMIGLFIRKRLSEFNALLGSPVYACASTGRAGSSTRFHQANRAWMHINKTFNACTHLHEKRQIWKRVDVVCLLTESPQCIPINRSPEIRRYESKVLKYIQNAVSSASHPT